MTTEITVKLTPLSKLKRIAKKLKTNLMVLYLAYRDPRVPLFAKLFAIVVVAYAFSPVDLIPDFIPVLGYVDDLLLVPLGVYVTLRLFPPAVLEEYRAKAEERRRLGKPKNWIAGSLFIATWILMAAWGCWYLYRIFK